ncbi:hypothetical protein HYW21_08145 [Candidatus Woesearchaeota archaeon]|nr:hypothetical protein [Candidatus Woesearchaeota archaeon]
MDYCRLKKRKVWYCLVTFACLFALVFFLPSARAITLTVEPKALSFQDAYLGGYSSKTIIITSDSEQIVDVNSSVSGQAKDWITIEPKTDLSVRKDSPVIFDVVLTPPQDVSPGSYDAQLTIFFSSRYLPTISVERETYHTIAIRIQLSATEHEGFVVENVTVFDTEVGRPLDLALVLANEGNLEANPVVTIKVKDGERVVAVNDYTTSIPPLNKKRLNLAFPFESPPGKYITELLFLANHTLVQQESRSFEVFSQGTLLKKGNLLAVDVNEQNTVGNPITIAGYFKNNGETSLNGILRATIYRDNVEVFTLESEEFYVPLGDTKTVHLMYTPQQVGTYRVVTQVYYEDTVTDEQQATFNVVEEVVPLGMSAMVLVISFILVLFTLRIVSKKHVEHE